MLKTFFNIHNQEKESTRSRSDTKEEQRDKYQLKA